MKHEKNKRKRDTAPSLIASFASNPDLTEWRGRAQKNAKTKMVRLNTKMMAHLRLHPWQIWMKPIKHLWKKRCKQDSSSFCRCRHRCTGFFPICRASETQIFPLYFICIQLKPQVYSAKESYSLTFLWWKGWCRKWASVRIMADLSPWFHWLIWVWLSLHDDFFNGGFGWDANLALFCASKCGIVLS